jgi:hypothetical protein
MHRLLLRVENVEQRRCSKSLYFYYPVQGESIVAFTVGRLSLGGQHAAAAQHHRRRLHHHHHHHFITTSILGMVVANVIVFIISIIVSVTRDL